MDYDYMKHSEVSQRYKSGANWFYWIAGLTIVTSLIAAFGGGIRFLLSLGITQMIDGTATALSGEGFGAAKVVALVLDLIVTGIFILFGFLAGKKLLWAYIIGMIAFTLDGLVVLLIQDIVGTIAHIVILFFLFRGFLAGRELLSLEKQMGEQAAAAQQAPV
jgi:hypothetical protein